MDSVAVSMRNPSRRAFDVLMHAQRCWDSMAQYRSNRARYKRYAYGDQWQDVVEVDGVRMTEEEYIKQQGNVPLKNNLVRRNMRTVLGLFRSQAKEPTCIARDRNEKKLGETMSVVLQYNNQLNQMQEVYARSMEEFLISALIVHRKWFGWRNNKLDCWTDYVNPNNFFIDNNMRDFRGWDVSCLGEIHDITFESLCGQFAKSPEDYLRLSQIYRAASDKSVVIQNAIAFGVPRAEDSSFLFPSDTSLCRVIEVWRKESKPRYRCHDYNTGEVFKVDVEDFEELVGNVNKSRILQAQALGMPLEDVPLITTEWCIDDYWYYYYLTPFGDILQEGETPYKHKSHPYVFKGYPFIDGELHPYVADFIDQQRYTNRLITLYDWIMRASAKGVLLFPEECLSDGMNIEDVADEWSRYNGVIAIKTKGTSQLPTQIASNATNVGIIDLLNVQLKLFEDISGVQGALQGKPGFSGMSASLNAQLAQSATTSLLDLLESFASFVTEAAYKDVKNIQQYYDTVRVFNISGKQAEYDPDKIKDVEFDLSVVESTSTPVYRQLANDFLMEIWRNKQITTEQLLQHGEFPFADDLLQSLQSQQEQIQRGETPDGISPEVMQQVQNAANPNATPLLSQFMGA